MANDDAASSTLAVMNNGQIDIGNTDKVHSVSFSIYRGSINDETNNTNETASNINKPIYIEFLEETSKLITSISFCLQTSIADSISFVPSPKFLNSFLTAML